MENFGLTSGVSKSKCFLGMLIALACSAFDYFVSVCIDHLTKSMEGVEAVLAPNARSPPLSLLQCQRLVVLLL